MVFVHLVSFACFGCGWAPISQYTTRNQKSNHIQVQTSCGFGVPLLTTTTTTTAAPVSHPKQNAGPETATKPILLDRDTMGHWARRKIETDSLLEYRANNNASSLDGCPGLRSAMRERGDWVALTLLKARVRRIGGQREAVVVGVVMGVLAVLCGQVVWFWGGLWFA